MAAGTQTGEKGQVEAMKLPRIPWAPGKTRQELVAMGGLNYSDQFREGDLRDARNLSARRWPYISTRRGREKQKDYAGVSALTAWGKLVAVRGAELLYDGTVVGTVTEGPKQFAMVNTKLVIWPDKVYLDMKTQTVKPLGAELTGSKAVFTANTMKVSGWDDLTEKIKAGDAVTLTGCNTKTDNNNDFVIKAVSKDTVTVTGNTFTACSEESAGLKLERKIPDLDFICESENRLWGCSNADQTIYSSSLGDPTNFFVYQGLSTDSYALAVGTDGPFTGCCKLTSSVLFWKETKLHKLLGSYPAEYSLYTYDIEGLRQGCHKSLQVINETLFYLGIHGVYAYTGGTPALISQGFGERSFQEAVSGSDGDTYYLSAKDERGWNLFCYEIGAGIWVREDETQAVDFTRIGRDLYFADAGGEVWLCDGGREDGALEWLCQFTPFYETVQGRKRYSKLLLRVELGKGSWLAAEIRRDGGNWQECGKLAGRKTGVFPLRIPVNRCDKLELRLRGKGSCAILSIMREFTVGSDRS